MLFYTDIRRVRQAALRAISEGLPNARALVSEYNIMIDTYSLELCTAKLRAAYKKRD